MGGAESKEGGAGFKVAFMLTMPVVVGFTSSIKLYVISGGVAP